MIWRIERSSATTGRQFGRKARAHHDALAGGLGLQLGDAARHEPVQVHPREGELHAAGADPGEVEQAGEQADHVVARDVDVLDVVPVALVADRPEALLEHDLGKTQDGIERRADLVADLGQEIRALGARLLGGALGRRQFALRLLEGGDVAQHGAIFALRALSDAPDRHEERDDAALADAAQNLATVVEEARHAVVSEPLEIFERREMALGGQQGGQTFARDFVLVVAEQRLRRSVERQDAALLVQHEDAVGGGVQDGGQLADAGFAGAQLEFERARTLRRIVVGQPAHQHQARREAVPLDRGQAHFDRQAFAAPVRQRQGRAAVLRPGPGRRAAAEQPSNAPVHPEMFDIAVIGEIEQNPVGEERRVAPVDQDAERQPLEHAQGVEFDRRSGAERSDVGERPRPPAGLGIGTSGLVVETRSERARDLAKCAALGVREAGQVGVVVSRRHVRRGGSRFLGRRPDGGQDQIRADRRRRRPVAGGAIPLTLDRLGVSGRGIGQATRTKHLC
jgi:hypothetical protein